MKIKTNDLYGDALDWAVAKCEGHDVANPKWWSSFGGDCLYSTAWAEGGPIIERERIEVFYIRVDNDNEPEWGAGKYGTLVEQSGPTPLIAAMRCYVASKMGDEIEVPDEVAA